MVFSYYRKGSLDSFRKSTQKISIQKTVGQGAIHEYNKIEKNLRHEVDSKINETQSQIKKSLNKMERVMTGEWSKKVQETTYQKSREMNKIKLSR